MEDIIKIHSDVIETEMSNDNNLVNKNDNIHYIEEKVKNAIVKLKEIIKDNKEKENEKEKLEISLNNLKIELNNISNDNKEKENIKKELEISLNNLKSDVEIIKKDELISLTISKNNLDNRLTKCLEEQTKNIIIARRSYHNINNKYWWSSIFILVLSSIITFIEALRLIIENTENKKIKELTYIISISSIFIGILITIITGYIKFNDYQNKLEIISSRLSLLLQYQKKIEVMKFQLTTYTLPKIDNDKNTIQCTKHNILSNDLLKGFINNLNKLEEDIQNNELLKYITDSCEIQYYREYVDTYIKDMMYNDYIKTLKEYLNNENKQNSENNENNEKIFERISKIVNRQGNNKINKMDFNLLKELKKSDFTKRKNNN